MKAYLITTGAVFGLITVMHIVHLFAEGPQMNPVSVLLTVAAAALCFWAWCLLRRSWRS
jgi:hypothetical protein